MQTSWNKKGVNKFLCIWNVASWRLCILIGGNWDLLQKTRAGTMTRGCYRTPAIWLQRNIASPQCFMHGRQGIRSACVWRDVASVFCFLHTEKEKWRDATRVPLHLAISSPNHFICFLFHTCPTSHLFQLSPAPAAHQPACPPPLSIYSTTTSEMVIIGF